MNFLKVLQARVRLLQAAGREAIIAGDINIMRAPIDSGEGGIRTSAAQHYEHPARVILNDWIAPRGTDDRCGQGELSGEGGHVHVLEHKARRKVNTKTVRVATLLIPRRSANYGSRIDLILCTPGLRPWIKGGDIEPKVFGSGSLSSPYRPTRYYHPSRWNRPKPQGPHEPL